jgi:hypothetical protein
MRKATITFAMSTRLSVLMEQLGSHWTDFYEILYTSIFLKSVAKIPVSLKSDKNNGYFTSRPLHALIISRSVLLRKKNVSDKSCREHQNTHFMFNNFVQKFGPLMRYVAKYRTAGQTTDDNVAHVHRMGT